VDQTQRLHKWRDWAEKRQGQSNLQNKSEYSISVLDNKNGTWNMCRLAAEEGFSYNTFTCLDKNKQIANCPNNCIGVNPNAIVSGGIAVGFAVAASGQVLGAPVGALGLLGAGAMNGFCPPGQCMRRGRCCALVMRRGIPRCPRRC